MNFYQFTVFDAKKIEKMPLIRLRMPVSKTIIEVKCRYRPMGVDFGVILCYTVQINDENVPLQEKGGLSVDSVCITVFGLEYRLPTGCTLMDAMQAIGYSSVHTHGCRNGVCGACSAQYRLPQDKSVRTCLACCTVIQDGMEVLSFGSVSPAATGLKPDESVKGLPTLPDAFPELANCRNCGLCSRMCPQGLDVRSIVGAAARNGIRACAISSFPCVMCGACAKVCPAGIDPSRVSMLARRLNGIQTEKQSESLRQRVQAIRNGDLTESVQALAQKSSEELRILYENRKTNT